MQKNGASSISIPWEQRLITWGITKDAPGIREDSYSFVTSSCFLSWFIFCSSLLAHCLVFCVVKWLHCFVRDIRTSCTSWIPVPSGVNKSVMQDLRKLLCLHFQGSMSWLSSSILPWQDTRLKLEWKYSHCKYFNNCDVILQKVHKVWKRHFTREAFKENDVKMIKIVFLQKIVGKDIEQHRTEVLERNNAWQWWINGEMWETVKIWKRCTKSHCVLWCEFSLSTAHKAVCYQLWLFVSMFSRCGCILASVGCKLERIIHSISSLQLK